MGWSTTSDLDRFAAAAGGYLRSRAAENILLLSAVQAVRPAREPRQAQQQEAGLLYGWWTPPDGGDPRGAFVHDPAVPLLISCRAPEMAAALAGTLAKLGRQVCGVDAPAEAADAFAAAWSQRAGTTVRVHRNSRVYRLTEQGTSPQGPGAPAAPGAWPPPGLSSPSGRLRVAAAGDLTLLTDWLTAFAVEASQRLPSPSDLAADLISYGGAVFWEVPHKPGRLREAAHYLAIAHHRDIEAVPQPVALATLTRPVAGTVRISMVYTPPERRRSGYAAAAIQAVSRALLWGTGPDNPVPGLLGAASAHGCVREIVMITDKNRPDRWGGRLGYQLAGERAVLRFGPATGAMPRANPTGPMPRLPTGPLPRLPRRRR
ncbi:MAG TPA: hypothetical protein VFO01_11345 [Trebonia sp.]|nr:hypothetical protein [Trebonia sp.]